MASSSTHSIALEILARRRSDMATVDALARLALEAGRLGLELRLVDTPPQLRELIAFAGLAEALGVEARLQAEEREQAFGIEEEGQLGNPAG